MLSNITKRLLPGGFNRVSGTCVSASSLFAANQTRCYASRRPKRPQSQQQQKSDEPLSLNNIPEEQTELPDRTYKPMKSKEKLHWRLENLVEKVDWSYFKNTPEKGFPQRKPAPIRPKEDLPPARGDMTVEKFLKAIGRGCAEYTDKFESWEQLMGADRWALKNAGIPIRQRKWIRNWVEKYKRGVEPYFVPIHSQTKRNTRLEWRQNLITQKAKRRELGLE
jgi:hypothetical protein